MDERTKSLSKNGYKEEVPNDGEQEEEELPANEAVVQGPGSSSKLFGPGRSEHPVPGQRNLQEHG